MHVLLVSVFASVAAGLRLETTETPNLDDEVLDAESQKLMDAVNTVREYCMLMTSGLAQELNDAHMAARDLCM